LGTGLQPLSVPGTFKKNLRRVGVVVKVMKSRTCTIKNFKYKYEIFSKTVI